MVWHLDHDLDKLRNFACIFPEVFTSFRLVIAKIELIQFNLDSSENYRSVQAEPINMIANFQICQ